MNLEDRKEKYKGRDFHKQKGGQRSSTRKIVTLGCDMEKAMAPTPVFLPGKSHGQRSLAGYSPWGHKESVTTERPIQHNHNKLLRLLRRNLNEQGGI